MHSMVTETTTINAGNAGKPGEAAPAVQKSAQAPAAAATTAIDPKNLTPEGMTRLLSTDLVEAEPASAPKAAARPPGEEVQPGAKAGDDEPKEPEWTPDQKAWFELRDKAANADEISAADGQAPEFSDEQRAWLEANETGQSPESRAGSLPEHLEAELEQWEKAGGTLPPALQKLVEKRIHKITDERDGHKQRADAAEAEVTRLTGELEQGARPPATGPGGMDEKSLGKTENDAKQFRADAKAFIDGYADEAATDRIQKWMTARGVDEKGLRRTLNDVGEWLQETLPSLKQNVKAFRQQETANEPVVKAWFPTLDSKDSEEGKFAAEVMRFVPELKSRSPAHRFAAGVYALGNVVWSHYLKANGGDASKANVDIIKATRELLARHVPITNGQAAFAGRKAPPRLPVRSGSPGRSPSATRKDAQAEEASQSIRENPSAENVTAALKAALV
jgi:hypothetical protein